MSSTCGDDEQDTLLRDHDYARRMTDISADSDQRRVHDVEHLGVVVPETAHQISTGT